VNIYEARNLERERKREREKESVDSHPFDIDGSFDFYDAVVALEYRRVDDRMEPFVI